MNKILVFQTRPGIGDLCIFLSSVHQIAKTFRDSEIILITKERTRAKLILKHDPYIKQIIYIDRDEESSKHSGFIGFFNLKKELEKLKPKTCFIMHHSFRYWLLCKILGASKIFSYEFFKKNENISEKIYNETKKWLSLSSYERSANVFWKKIDTDNSIAIGIGSSGESRKWNYKHYVKLIQDLSVLKPVSFCIFGGKQELRIFENIKKDTDKNIKLFSACEMDLENAINLLKTCKLYVGTDSGFMHLSGALGIKSFGLFGDTPTNYVDYSKYITPIIPEGYQSISHNSNAMDKITPDHVLNAVKNFI